MKTNRKESATIILIAVLAWAILSSFKVITNQKSIDTKAMRTIKANNDTKCLIVTIAVWAAIVAANLMYYYSIY